MSLEKLKETAEFIKTKTTSLPEIAIVLGSGLGPLAGLIEKPVVIPYEEIPNFATSTVFGHAGELVIGSLNGKQVVCMNGRFHYYEGYSFETIVFPLRSFKTLGVNQLILTNAVGGINLSFKAGDLMIIEDHINLMGSNPLIGPNLEELGPRFPDMTDIYSKSLRTLAKTTGESLGIELKEGVYAALTGPSYETPAEIKMLRSLGVDSVGMSTVPEAIVARHMGMEILAISCVTNAAAGISDQPLSHDEVTAVADKVKNDFIRLLSNLIGKIETTQEGK